MANGKPARGKRVARWLIGGIGGLLVLGGVLVLLASYDFVQNALPARGTVVALDVTVNKGRESYRPEVQFLDATGRKWRARTLLSSSSYGFDIGTRVDILYDRRDPQSIRMDRWFELWGLAVPFLVVGFVLLIPLAGSLRNRKLRPVEGDAGRKPAAPRPRPETGTPETGGGIRRRGAQSGAPTVRRRR